MLFNSVSFEMTGGTIILFDRKMLRNFRKDGYNWKKKKDGKTVKEAHEHLKVNFSGAMSNTFAHACTEKLRRENLVMVFSHQFSSYCLDSKRKQKLTSIFQQII